MNVKESQIINLFALSRKKKYEITELSKLLGVGKRSILNYINNINIFLSKFQLPTIEIEHDCVYMNATNKEFQMMKKYFYDSSLYEYHFSQEERVSIIIYLLYQRDYLSISKIQQLLEISRRTCIYDIKKVIEHFEKHGILIEKTKNGYHLIISEVYRRDFLFNYITLFIDLIEGNSFIVELSGINLWMSKNYNFSRFRSLLEPIIYSWQRQNNLKLEGYQYDQLFWVLNIMIYRIQTGHTLENINASFSKHSKQLSRVLLNKVNHLSNVKINEYEVVFLAIYLDSINITYQDTVQMENVPSNIVIRAFLANVSRRLDFDILNDETLFQLLTQHIKQSFGLMNINKYLFKDIHDELYNDYPNVFSAVSENIYILEQSFHNKYDTQEISFLVMHIATAITNSVKKNEHIKVIIISNEQTSVNSYISYKIRNFCDVDEISIIPIYNFEERLRKENLISTVIISLYDLNSDEYSIIKIYPTLGDEDILLIQKAINQIKNRCFKNQRKLIHNEQYTKSLISMFSSDSIALDVEVKEWKEAIQISGSLLLKNDLITQKYIDEVITNVETNGPYFVFWPGIALAHSYASQKDMHFTVSLLRLKHPIPFGNETNDPVKYVITFAASDKEENEKYILQLIELVSNLDFVPKMNQAKNNKEAVDILYEMELRG